MPRSWLAAIRQLGIEPGWPGRVVVEGGAVLVLCLDPDDPPPRVEGAASLIVATDRRVAVHGSPLAETIPLRQLSLARARGGAATAPLEIVVHSLETAHLGPILVCARLWPRRFHFTHSVGASLSAPPATALLLGAIASAMRLVAALLRKLRLRPVVAGWELAPPPPTRRAVRRALAQAVRVAPRSSSSRTVTGGGAPRSIAHYIGELGSGGAERQLTYLALAQAARGHRVTVLTALPVAGANAHFVPELTRGGVAVKPVPPLRAPLASVGPRPALRRGWAGSSGEELRAAVDAHPARRRLVPLVDALRESLPDVLHCWLDEPNAVGGLAGAMAGVPRVVLSTRNLSPAHFERLFRTWYRASYRLLAHGGSVRLIANSRAGADDYAHWCGIRSSRFHVVYNGIDASTLTRPDAARRAARRRELGIDEHAFVVVGVFRLAAEKRPMDFLEVLARLRAQVPSLRAIHVGVGPDESQVRARAASLGLDGCLRFAGRHQDPAAFFGIADASLLTSVAEGCPNVALESQALEVPVVLTRAAGSPEAVLDGETGVVCEVGDLDALAMQLAGLARDSERARALGKRGRELVGERFSIARMVDATFDVYA